MAKNFTTKLFVVILLVSALSGVGKVYAQQTPVQQPTQPGQSPTQVPNQYPSQYPAQQGQQQYPTQQGQQFPNRQQQYPGQQSTNQSQQQPFNQQARPGQNPVQAQPQQTTQPARADTGFKPGPIQLREATSKRERSGLFFKDPPGLVRTVEYDPATNRYVLYERLGNLNYRAPQYLTFSEYLLLQQRSVKREYFQQLSDNYAFESEQPGFIPQMRIRSKTFEQIFGSNVINIRPQGSAEVILAGQVNKNENPLFNTRQRNQFNFNFDQRIQLNVTGDIGDKLKITTNYNTQAQFQFENQIKLDYTGHPDEIIQKIEAGTVSMPLNTTLITGSQALFGVKTKLKFGNLDVTSIFSQQRSQAKNITISNGSQQGNISITAADYEANKHYFLSQYFRNNYNRALANIPIISSNINITKIEVWTTNRTSVTTDSRDILAFLDLGENKPYNPQFSGVGFTGYPAGFQGPGFPQQSNNLLSRIPAGARNTNSNDIATYFRATGSTDNYAKLTYARKLKDNEFTLHPQLGYISLNYPLNNDEVLAVAYQYTVNGVQYQVGEFSSDKPVNTATPTVLYTKLLKNELLKTSLPTWDLMMKNIYSLGASQISATNFKLNVSRLDDKSGIEKTIMDEGTNTKSKRWLQITGLDNLNQQNDKSPDGYFDFLEGITIDSQNGRIMFPTVEPFGSDLAKQFTPAESDLNTRYVYQALYDSTKTIAQQLFPKLNRYLIKGTYTGQNGSEYQLNAVNIPQGSVIVTAGNLKLQEGTDYTIDYSAGRLRMLNQALMQSGQQINIKLENNELFGVQQKSLWGTRLDYHVNPKLALGATMMHLTEQPLNQNEIVGQESISNTIWGFDANYSSESRFLTRLVDKIPFIHTKAPSTINFSGEFAQLRPGSPSALNFAGSKNGTSYLDDFENSRTIIDIKGALNWQLSGTPQMFPESNAFDDLSYGYNRARLAFYNIDPIFYTNSGNIPVSRSDLSNHYVRQVLEQEVFPYKQSTTGQPLSLATLNLAFYPGVRGPYNYTTTGINTDGSLQTPQSRWGGIFRKLETNDFESLNVGYIEFWMLDPFTYKPNSRGGDLYFNLGSVSEDILKDGRKSLENALPVDGVTPDKVDETNWGRVSKLQPVVNAFDNDPNNRRLQDVGLDGLNDADEKTKFAPVLQQTQGILSPQAAAALAADPSSDNYRYYQGQALDQAGAGILERYSMYNGMEGNSKTAEQSQAELGIQTSASTSLPDGEDINRDNNMSQADEYYQYRVSIRPQDMVVGQNYINDKITANVKLPNGTTEAVTWYQFRVPITDYTSKVGNIQDFKAIRFMRMFLTNFQDTSATVLRFATLQLSSSEWRTFNAENNPINVIADPAIPNPVNDGSVLDVQAVNIEENGNRTPIPYVVPPGINRQRNYNNLQTDTKLNEQSLSLNVTNLRDGYSRAAFRTFYNDLRSYKRVQMFIHAEGDALKNNDLNAFVRLGVDYQDNYYEYELPLAVTLPGTRDPGAIWPSVNELNLELSLLTDAKLARNNAKLNGQPWPFTVPFVYTDGANKITIKGQPDLSRLRTIMLGVRNPYKNNSMSSDDGLNKTGTVWFDELRLTDFDQRGGWAATARVDAALADFANITVSGSMSTIGFGTLDSRVSDRNRSDNKIIDASASVELGKFFPEKSGIRIPAYVNISTQKSTPQYDPGMPDVELKKSLAAAPTSQARDSIKRVSEDFTIRKSINFTNVHKERMDPSAPVHVWDVENFAATYAYTEYRHNDFIVENDMAKTYRVALNYNYSNQPKFITPFAKIIKSNLLALARDFNFSILPSRLNFSINFDRFYSENTLRNNDPNNFIPIPTSYNKNFNITRVYGIGWNLSKSLSLDIDATNLSVVDEPAGRITGLKRDTLWDNLMRLGRTVNYNHTINVNYTTPINKIPGLEWTALTARYSTNFNWQSQPTFAINNPTYDVGNSIQNARTIQLNPNLNFANFYNKFRGLRNGNSQKSGAAKLFLGILTSIKNVSGTYTRTQGTFLPGYLPKSNFFGQDLTYDAPGIGFLLGSQTDIRPTAIAKGWITTDTLQNQLFVRSLNEDIQLRSIIEPLPDLRIELRAFRTQDKNYQTQFKYLESTQQIENLSPVTSGTYSVSFLSIGTAFSKGGDVTKNSAAFQKFLDNRAVVSQRLGQQNPNSGGTTDGYADGYGPNAQNVLVPAFLAAYTGKDAGSVNLTQFPKIPIPNWDIKYSGLSRLPLFSDLFESIDLRHVYRSSYNVSAYTTLLQYQTVRGHSVTRDANQDFLPLYQFSQVSILESFLPLLGADIRFKNSMTANIEFSKNRFLNLSMLNSQLAQQDESIVVLGFGYRPKNFRMPFGLFGTGNRDNNDVNFKLDVAIRDKKLFIYRADVPGAEISSGAKNITLRPSIDYVINQRFNLNLFYDSNITKPYTSQAFTTAFTNFGINLKLLLQ